MEHTRAGSLSIGDRVRLSGGYEHEPRWLGGAPAFLGTLVQFIPGQNESPAAVVRLDAAITVDGATGDILVLELRYTGAQWKDKETVHVELCDFMPEPKAWQHRRQGKWIESHASYERVENGAR